MKKIVLLTLCSFFLTGCGLFGGKKIDPSASYETCLPQSVRKANAAKFKDKEKREYFLRACKMTDIPNYEISPKKG